MKRSNAFLLIMLALLLGFGAAMGYYLMERKRFREKLTQLQTNAVQHASRLYEFTPVIGLNERGESEVQFYVKIEQALPLRVQLSTLANAISRHCFNYLPIEIQGIQEYDGKKVAVINLNEFDGFVAGETWYGASWAHGFFQGSAGGASTSTILIESFLQRDSPLPWIDGVAFLYQEKSIRQFEHAAALEQTVFRKK